MGQQIQLYFETQGPLPPKAAKVLGWITSEPSRNGRVFIIEQIDQSDKENPDLQSALSLLIRYLSESDDLAIDFGSYMSPNLKILVKSILRQKYPNFENVPLTAEEILVAVSEDLQGFYLHGVYVDNGPYFIEEDDLPVNKVIDMYKEQVKAIYEAESRKPQTKELTLPGQGSPKAEEVQFIHIPTPRVHDLLKPITQNARMNWEYIPERIEVADDFEENNIISAKKALGKFLREEPLHKSYLDLIEHLMEIAAESRGLFLSYLKSINGNWLEEVLSWGFEDALKDVFFVKRETGTIFFNHPKGLKVRTYEPEDEG